MRYIGLAILVISIAACGCSSSQGGPSKEFLKAQAARQLTQQATVQVRIPTARACNNISWERVNFYPLPVLENGKTLPIGVAANFVYVIIHKPAWRDSVYNTVILVRVTGETEGGLINWRDQNTEAMILVYRRPQTCTDPRTLVDDIVRRQMEAIQSTCNVPCSVKAEVDAVGPLTQSFGTWTKLIP